MIEISAANKQKKVEKRSKSKRKGSREMITMAASDDRRRSRDFLGGEGENLGLRRKGVVDGERES